MGSRGSLLAKVRSGTVTTMLVIVAVGFLVFNQESFAWLAQSQTPFVDPQSCIFDPASATLILKGGNFQKGATVELRDSSGLIQHGTVKVKGTSKVLVRELGHLAVGSRVDVKVVNPDGTASLMVTINVVAAADDRQLTSDDVKKIIAQAVAQAEASGLKAHIAVVDSEGNSLGIFSMTGAPAQALVGETAVGIANDCKGDDCGLEGVRVPACTAALSKAITGSFLSSQGHAFSTRTASFIVQEHFTPGTKFQGSGPLFGVQFSQLLCSDVNARSPLGLAADPGGIPIYKNGLKVGGIGIEGDGKYALDPDPRDKDVPVEELVAVAAVRGFEAPSDITGDKIVVNGIRFPYVNAEMPSAAAAQSFDRLNGAINVCVGLGPAQVRDAQPSRFRVVNLDPSIPAGRVDNRFFPFRSSAFSGGLTASEVQRILVQGAFQAFLTRAAIRQPLNSITEVNLTVCDVDGTILGIYSTIDAPIFGFDVSAQKARTAAFFSSTVAAARLRGAGLGRYVDAAAADGLRLDGSVAFSDRAVGFLARPFYPDGIDETEHGPFSKSIEEFSPFNVGLQLDLVLDEYFVNVLKAIAGDAGAAQNAFTPPCPSFSALANGAQIFPGSVPLYKNGRLVGAIGVSGDGVDQDDLISTMGSTGFESPPEIRVDRVFVRDVRLPFVKFPRHPNRD